MVSAEKHLNIWKNDFFNGNLVVSTTVDLFLNVYILQNLKKYTVCTSIVLWKMGYTHQLVKLPSLRS